MPTYEYQCQACEHQFEEFQSITAKALKKCPACGKSKLQRLIGIGGGVLFKGSGFYETDYRSESYKKAAKNDSGEGKAADSSGEKATGKSGAAKTDAAKTDAAKSDTGGKKAASTSAA